MVDKSWSEITVAIYKNSTHRAIPSTKLFCLKRVIMRLILIMQMQNYINNMNIIIIIIIIIK